MKNIWEQSFARNARYLTPIILVGVTTFVVLVLVSHLYKFYQRLRKRKKHLKRFGGPPGEFISGHFKHVTLDQAFLDKLVKWSICYDGTYRLRLFNHDVLVLCEPETLAAVMNTSGPKDDLVYSLLAEWIGQGILTSEGPQWFRNRRLLSPAFHFEILKPYTKIFQQTATTLINKWKNMGKHSNESVEMFEHFSLMTLDSLLKTAFSIDVDCQNIGNDHPYIKAVYQISDATLNRINSVFLRINLIFYNLTSQGWATRNTIKVAKQFTKDIVKQRQENKTGKQDIKQGKCRDFVDMLLDAKDEDGNGLTDEEILDEVDTFMFAGHDTTASGLSWFMYNMARNPEHQERCREEIQEVLDGRESITWSDLSNLDYLSMCIKESLRLHGPVTSVSRYLTEDIKFQDGRIAPAGTYIWLNLYGIHHNPYVWENPEEFDPYRFSPENSEGRHSHAYVPFSAGPRNCIGQHLALNEMKIVAAQVLKNFHVDIDPERTPKRNVSLVLRSKDGVWLKLRPL